MDDVDKIRSEIPSLGEIKLLDAILIGGVARLEVQVELIETQLNLLTGDIQKFVNQCSDVN